jgi:hypothetical protein
MKPITAINTRLIAPVLVLLLAGHMSATRADETSGNIAAKPVGTATRAWLNEQREGRNRAEPEPWPAERAGAALRRYENTYTSPADTSGATRSGTAIGIRSGSNTNSGSAGGMTGGMGGMTR